MDFKTIYEAVMNKCNVDSDDTQAIGVIKLGINEAYGEISKLEGLIANAPLPIINGVVNLPDDLLDIKAINPSLSGNDRKDGSKIFTDKTGTLNITYSYLPEDLAQDGDEPEISLKYHKLLITYGCFAYYQFKKKEEMAASYFNSYTRGLKSYESPAIPTKIVEVYGI